MPNGKLKARSDANRKLDELMLEALVLKASEGDKDALCKLCEKIAKGVLFQVTYILGKPEGVEDVSQEILIRICENIHSLRNPKAFRAWLSRIIINEKNRYLEKSIKQGDVLNIDDYLEKEVEESGEFIPQEYVESKELRERIKGIIMGLPMRQREAIIMHYYDGLSVTEIAKILDVATQSVSKNLAIARGKLKKELGEELRDDGIMGSMAMLPIGTALAEILQRESADFVMGEASIRSFVTNCSQSISIMNDAAHMPALPVAATMAIAGAWLAFIASIAARHLFRRHSQAK